MTSSLQTLWVSLGLCVPVEPLQCAECVPCVVVASADWHASVPRAQEPASGWDEIHIDEGALLAWTRRGA